MTENDEIKRYVITGGSSGIGLETSRLLLKKKHTVFVLSRKAESSSLKEFPNCHLLNVDIRHVQDIDLSVEWVKKILGNKKIDGLINCAGVGYNMPLKDITEERYELFFDTNVKGLIFASQRFLPLIKHNVGIILNMSSIAGFKKFADWSVYCATKHAVEGFAGSIREELRPLGIRVTNIRPGAVDTPLYGSLSAEDKVDFMSPSIVAEFAMKLLELPTKVCVEDIFINNSVGDL